MGQKCRRTSLTVGTGNPNTGVVSDLIFNGLWVRHDRQAKLVGPLDFRMIVTKGVSLDDRHPRLNVGRVKGENLNSRLQQWSLGKGFLFNIGTQHRVPLVMQDPGQ